ncbi:hypothetical protein FJZ36_09870 [Candidatus Poribacteria bacterium]|nr:hypothetical protein [Candidatus Poribacteria bacterium]
MKLNVGCGMDYREGYVNIDASDRLPRVDLVLDVSDPQWRSRFTEASAERIVAQDLLEHHFHWQAVRLLADFLWLLQPGGDLEVRVPDAARLLRRWWASPEKRVRQLFGGQDIASPRDSAEMEESRRMNPELFCHRYAYTRAMMRTELKSAGYADITTTRQGPNFVAKARKPK